MRIAGFVCVILALVPALPGQVPAEGVLPVGADGKPLNLDAS